MPIELPGSNALPIRHFLHWNQQFIINREGSESDLKKDRDS